MRTLVQRPVLIVAVGATYVVNAPWVFTAVWKVRPEFWSEQVW